MKLTEALKEIGFTKQEAALFIQLSESGPLSGYEAAKLAGISRSNAYASLKSLTDKGYVNIIEGQTSTYVSIPKAELIKNVTRQFNQNIHIISEALLYNKIKNDPYITITGQENILNKLKNIISSANHRIYLSCNPIILKAVEIELLDAISKELKVVILCPDKLSTSRPYTYYNKSIHDSIKIIVDTSTVLAGTFHQALFSSNITLVSIIRESFINELALLDNGSGIE